MKTRRKGSGMGDGQVHTFGPRFPQVRANEYADDQSAQLTTGTQVAIAVAVIIDARGESPKLSPPGRRVGLV